MEVDRNAPAYAEGTIQIDAPRDLVWDVLVGFGEWPSWQAGVSAVFIAEPAAPGVKFKWKTGSGTIRSTIDEVDAPSRISWQGRTLGIKADHAWQLDDVDGGGTRVSTQEGWRGFTVRILRRTLQSTLQQATDDGLVELKAEAERRAL
jgi:hypothetical protein